MEQENGYVQARDLNPSGYCKKWRGKEMITFEDRNLGTELVDYLSRV